MKRTYKGTLVACCTGYLVQAVVNNLAPLLFIIFQDHYGLSYSRLATLVSINFGTQLIVDILAARYTDKIGRRKMALIAHTFATVGLLCMGLTPFLLKGNEFFGFVTAAVLYAVGGGIIEVIITPIAADCPTDNKSGVISILHSFYCWGQMGVILISTLILFGVGRENWVILPFIWAILPFVNALNFISVPIVPAIPEEKRTPFKHILTSKIFILIMILIFAGGASELAMSQWASIFAERGLGVSKTVGDIAGPCLFACLMGIGRVAYGKFSEKLPLKPTVAGTALLCVICYLTASLSGNGLVALAACAVTGFSITIMWPAAVIFAEKQYPDGGTGMYGTLAVAGDIGCAVGPWLIGLISDGVESGALPALINADTPDASGLKTGILAAVIFPLTVLLTLIFIPDKKEKKHE